MLDRSVKPWSFDIWVFLHVKMSSDHPEHMCQAALLSKLAFLHIHYFDCNQAVIQLVVDFSGCFCFYGYTSMISL